MDGGLIGIGGSPGSSVFVKCGITAAEPRREAVDGSYRLTLDKGNQGQDGPDMAIVGNLEKENGQRPGQYEWKSYRCRAMAVPGQDGKVYLSFGIDSGFEGLSCYYLDSADIAWEEAQPLSRGAAIQTLWESLGRPTGEAEPFPDTAKDAPYAAALAWARSLGIARGYADGSFRPEESLSRQQALPLLYRATGSPEVFWAPLPAPFRGPCSGRCSPRHKRKPPGERPNRPLPRRFSGDGTAAQAQGRPAEGTENSGENGTGLASSERYRSGENGANTGVRCGNASVTALP